MEARKLILYTFLFFLAVLLTLGIANYLPFIVDGINFGSLPFEQKTYKDTDPELEMIDTGKGPVLLFVPGKGADRNWNSPTLANRAGLRLSAELSEAGISIIRFDRIDAGEKPEVYIPVSERAKQVVKAVNESGRILNANNGPRPFYILAHDEGCIDTLIALEEVRLQVQGVILTGCAYSGTVLDQWYDRINYNMKLSGITRENRQKVHDYWNKILAQKEPEPVSEEDWQRLQRKFLDEGMHADVVAGRKTISVLLREENLAYFREARSISFEKLIAKLANKTTIYQLVGENDEEIPPETVSENRDLANEYKYPFILLEDTGHFLFEQDPPGSPVENMAMRRSPFAEISPAFVKEIKRILPLQSGQ